jgi:hypothetical protein
MQALLGGGAVLTYIGRDIVLYAFEKEDIASSFL